MTTPVNLPATPPRPATKPFWVTPIGITLAIGLAALLAIGGLVVTMSDGRTRDPGAEVELTACDIDSGGFLPSATIGYTLTNTGSRERTFYLDFAVVDSSGARVGDDSEIVSDVAPGSTVKGESIVMLDGSGSKCALAKVR